MTKSSISQWRPTTTIDALHQRAKLYAAIRSFFAERGVLEVETPILSQFANTDPHIQSIACQRGFLHTSPEFAMKRLLAAGSGSIYQICKTFRQEESGRWHNPEFTMLEWYRVNFNHFQLMHEVSELLQAVLGCEPATTVTYQQTFIDNVGIDPLARDIDVLRAWVNQQGILASGADTLSYDDLLHLVFSHCVEPNLGQQAPAMVVCYPASQSALARVNSVDPRIADRFEVYYRGVELANGFYELSDANEQRQRFELDNHQRALVGQPEMPLDEHLLAAIAAGLPDCAGVALGLDRLLMLALDAKHIDEVIAFPASRA